MLKKLKTRFILICMLMVSIVLVLVMVSITAISYRLGRSQILFDLGNTSMAVLSGGEIPKDNEDHKAPFAGDFFSFPTVTVILNSDMQISEAYENEQKVDISDDIRASVDSILKKDKNKGIIFKNYIMYRVTPAQDRAAISFTSLDSLFSMLTISVYASLISMLGCLILFLILSTVLSGIAMKPVEAAWEREKQFVEDASHDLKTPITVILANTEIIKSKNSDKAADISGWLESTKEEAERMRRLVDSMLELAESESFSENILMRDTNISEICEKTVLQMEAVAFEKNVFIDSDISKNVIFKSDAEHFTRLTYILVDNALKYAPVNTGVTVTLKKIRREIKLSVKNEKTYIAPEHIPHIFERFWRADKARSSGSFGLGLAIAKNITESLGGRITVSSKESFGTEFILTFSPISKIL